MPKKKVVEIKDDKSQNKDDAFNNLMVESGLSSDDIASLESEPASTSAPEPEPTPEPAAPKPDKENVPQPHTKRWNQIYGENEQRKRDITDLKAQLTAVQEHNKQLFEAISGIETKVTAATPRPDPQEEPDKYDAWIIDQVMAKSKSATPVAPFTPDLTPVEKAQTPNVQYAPGSPEFNLAVQEGVMRSLNSDYDEMIGEAMQDIDGNTILRGEIFGSVDPAKAAYAYGKAKREKRASETKTALAQGHVESSTTPPAPTSAFTPEEEAVCKGLGISKEDYRKQAEIIQKMKAKGGM
jgi:hypothetical protein